MVLDQVTQRAGVVVVARTAFERNLLRRRYLDVVHVRAVPDRFEDAVREAQHQRVLDRLLAEVVVDPVDLLLVEHRQQGVVEVQRRREVVAERLLDDDARLGPLALAHPGLPQLLGDRLEELRRHRQVEDAVEDDPGLLVLGFGDLADLREDALVVERARHIARTGQQRIEHRFVGLPPRELLDRILGHLAELVIRPLGARAADQVEALWQGALVREVVDRRQQLALRKVAGRAEYDERGRVDREPLEALGERILLLLRRRGGGEGHQPSACAGALLFTAWPPNWLRSAAFTFAANAFCPRELKRSYSEVVMTGVGMRLSIASSMVQRPSPESSTYGSRPSRSLPSISNARA